MKTLWTAVVILLLSASVALGAWTTVGTQIVDTNGSLVLKDQTFPVVRGHKVRVLWWHYEIDDEAHTTLTGTGSAEASHVTGTITQVVAVPNTTYTPDNDWYFEIRDSDKNGYDILNGAGDAVTNSPSTEPDDLRRTPVDAKNAGYIRVVDETLRFYGSLCGSGSCYGDVYLYVDM
jgi:hypothetical protein